MLQVIKKTHKLLGLESQLLHSTYHIINKSYGINFGLCRLENKTLFSNYSYFNNQNSM